jgi:cell division GTPase FtsZ
MNNELMNSKIGFVAIGQAGGNIGQIFEKRGYSVLYLNTSKEDLDTIKDGKYKYHITAGEGCNKDRHKAKKLIVEDFNNILTKIDDTVKADMLFVVFSSGGGTGSGAGPMLVDMLVSEGRDVGVITVIPSITESLKTQVNTYECFQEMVNIENCGSCFILDNDKGKDRLAINAIFVNALCAFLDIPDKYNSKKGNIDVAEIMESLKAHGMASVSQFTDTDVAKLVEQDKNIFAPIQDDKVIKYITVAAYESLTNMQDITKVYGEPWDIFRAYTSRESIMFISGLSYPVDRLDKIHHKVEDNKDSIIKNLSSGTGTSLTGNFDFLTPKMTEKKVEKVHSRDDIFKKYL